MGEFCDSLLLLELELHGLEGGGGLHGPGPVNLRDLHHGGRGGGSLKKYYIQICPITYCYNVCLEKSIPNPFGGTHCSSINGKEFFFVL